MIVFSKVGSVVLRVPQTVDHVVHEVLLASKNGVYGSDQGLLNAMIDCHLELVWGRRRVAQGL